MTTAVQARLTETVEAVYAVFTFPTPALIEGCPCCISTREVDVLLTTPLREISGQQLWRYVSGAFLTIGSEDDFRYFLPRILDLSVSNSANSNDPEIIIGKLSLANWRSWSAREQPVIEELLDAWFEQALARDLEGADDGWIGSEAESVLCGAARAGLPLQRWLGRLNEPDAALVLKDMSERFPDQLSPFWEEIPSSFREFTTIFSQGSA